MVEFSKEIENDGGGREASDSAKASNGSRSNSSMGLADAFKRMKEKAEGMSERLGFVDGLVAAFKEGTHTNILVQPGTGPAIPAHRAVLATYSKIFRIVLSSDECKAPAESTISLPELSYEELQCLLEFLYCGTLKPDDRVEKHVCSLLIAADKYDIPFLKRFCEARILSSLGPSNALQVLEVSDMSSNTKLKEQAMNTIVKHKGDVITSRAYESFAMKNAHLCVEITRALLT